MIARIDDIIKFKQNEKIIDGVVIEKENGLLIIDGYDGKAYQCIDADVIKLLGRVTHRENNPAEKKGYSNPELKDTIEFNKWRKETKNKL